MFLAYSKGLKPLLSKEPFYLLVKLNKTGLESQMSYDY